jgi:uncharacterized membrane protein
VESGAASSFSALSAAQGSIVVRGPIGSVYRQWVQIEDFPKFMPALKKVQKLDDGHFAIVFSLKGKRHEGVLEILLQVPERRLAWRALVGRASEHFAAGVVSFTSRPDQSTCVTLKVSSACDAAASRRMHRYLRNFKRFMETPRGRSEIFYP